MKTRTPKAKFPKVGEIRTVFQARDRSDPAQVEMEARVNGALSFWSRARWNKVRQMALVHREHELLQAKNWIVQELWERRRMSHQIPFKSVDGLEKHWRDLEKRPKLAYSIVSEKQLFPVEEVGQAYEGGGYLGLEAKKAALRELIQHGHVLEVPPGLLGPTAEVGYKYYVLVADEPRKIPHFDAPGIGKLILQMQAARTRLFRIVEDPATRIYYISGKRRGGKPPKKRR